MSECHMSPSEYRVTCCPIQHDIPSEVEVASCLAVSDTCLILVNSETTDRLLLFDLSQSAPNRREIDWPRDTYGLVRDMAWSNHINAFLILSNDVICAYSPSSNQLRVELHCSPCHDRLWSVAVLGCDTYVLYRSDLLYRYCLPTWTFTRRWSRSDLISIDRSDKYIEQIRAQNSIGFIALLIRMKHHHQWRIDLFDRTMKKLFSGECLRMASAYPIVSLHAYGQQGQWTLFNEDYLWLTDSHARFLQRHRRIGKKDIEK